VSGDLNFMRLALALGRRNLGITQPNPSVGAVVVDPESGTILAAAATAPGGRPHAEPLALAQAGEAARGATLYVTLEPCSHHGRTPPCTDAILAAGIGRVVSAMDDPDPRVAGRGHALLRAAGVAVETGLCREEAARDHRGHSFRVTRGRPMLHLKLARTRDGFAAGAGTERLRITGPVTDGAVHLWRARADAILVGIGTARADDPSLTVRLPGLAALSPQRIVLDSTLRLTPASVLARTARDVPVMVLTTRAAPVHARRALEACDIEVVTIPADGAGRIDLPAALERLGEFGLTRLCSEGGPRLAEALAEADLIDTVTLMTGPDEAGPAGGLPALGPALTRRIAGFTVAEDLVLGRDRAVTYERSL
jgi:diaminohydroxyphosphoribosylaminopyrimidine deaminase/5-amino-6-(5-phosphoribosylamino)uracil reductase